MRMNPRRLATILIGGKDRFWFFFFWYAYHTDLYIIPNPNGPGKRVIRRPHPPPTTVALDEDFDAVTVEEASTIYAGNGQRYIYRLLDSEGNTVKGVNLHQTDSPEHGHLGLRLGQTEGALSDLNIENGRATITSMGSGPRGSGPVGDKTGARQSMGTEDDRGLDPRATTTNVGDGEGTQISYEEFYRSDMATEPLAQTNRKSSHHNTDPRRFNGNGGGSKSKGNDMQGMGSRRRSTGRKTDEQPRSFSSPAYSYRSSRMYSAAELDVPPPPSEFSSSEVAPGLISGSLRTKKNSESRDHIRTSAVITNRTSSSSTDSAKASSTSSLDEFLCTFQPSLGHIAPILTSLGIRDEDHFRAIAKLSAETRDREVREVALQQGMTVVEWAMLLDKTRSM
ncbi:hypothetical protein PILCRDRAFT_91017 [Piloderma croceum F 1598]|uniref:Uncharacterized protein n=1 Tax=Piloderma croceum (strain F 1598) TaxID=765440 RepID=A0A0C3AUW8_PILCF|nr:hypothetical protein PILCRDRAFT_91017 [Piloderma croceum F 1598]